MLLASMGARKAANTRHSGRGAAGSTATTSGGGIFFAPGTRSQPLQIGGDVCGYAATKAAKRGWSPANSSARGLLETFQ